MPSKVSLEVAGGPSVQVPWKAGMTAQDVDAIAEITSYVEYAKFSEKLKGLGFREDTREGAPLCRWRQETTTLDVMPLNGEILGFRNSWYEPAMKASETRELESGLQVRVVSSVYFCASKLEAFGDRGKNDYLGSREEDVVTVVDGRPELVREIREASSDVRSYVAKRFAKLCGTQEFLDALPGHLAPDTASQEQTTIIVGRLKEIASL